MKNFWIRTASATVYAALMILVICFDMIFPQFSDGLDNRSVFGFLIEYAFFLFVMVVGLFEFYRMAEAKGLRPMKVLGYVAGLVLFGILLGFIPVYEELLLSTVVCMILAPLLPVVAVLLALFRKEGNPFADLGVTILGVLYVALPLMLFVLLGDNSILGQGVMMMVVVLIWLNDAFAYMGGSLIGKHKLWPRHSPGKTWEGCAVGLLFSILAAIFVGPLLGGEFSWYVWLLIAVFCSVIGTLGDLAESMFKRSCGVKDSGTIMPGHGGILDRFDSILAVTPFLLIIAFIAH
ncbi:MAG: phosphatidate cytidylyltransferase [Bacteroidales bacterium]|nr:phosphatidate cytidylyltransferase [Bacteroidales bacterium]